MSAWRKIAEGLVTAIVVVTLLYVILEESLNDELPARRNFAIGFVLFFGSILNAGAVAFLRKRDAKYEKAANDIGATVRFSRPRSDTVTVLICFLVGAVGSAFLLFSGVGWFVPSFLLLVFGGFSAASLLAMSRRQVRSLTLSPIGLDYSPFGAGPIAWPDIEKARMSKGRTTVIALKLVDETKYRQPGRRPFWARGNRLSLGTPFAFLPAAFDASPRLIMHAIETRLSKFGRPDRAALAKTL